MCDLATEVEILVANWRLRAACLGHGDADDESFAMATAMSYCATELAHALGLSERCASGVQSQASDG